jgi:hypothetical protein
LKILGPTTEANMVLAFLRAELNSPTHPTNDNTAGVRYWLAKRRFDPSLIEQGDATDETQNAKRELVLGDWRGYKRNAILFVGFPDDVSWSRALPRSGELAEARYTASRPADPRRAAGSFA